MLEISGEASCQLVEESQTVPETLSLRCRLRPLPQRYPGSKMQLISEGKALEESPLYADATIVQGYERLLHLSRWQGIAVVYEGAGQGKFQGNFFVFQGLEVPWGRLEIGQPLYIKPFATEDQDYQLRVTTVGEGEVLSTPPGMLNTKMLRGYGGYYQPGIPLEEMEQVYYSLTSDYEKTKVRLHSSATLRSQHTPPPHGGRDFNETVVFSPTLMPQEYLSLPACLAAGDASLDLVTPWATIPYRSYGCKSVGRDTLRVEFSVAVSN